MKLFQVGKMLMLVVGLVVIFLILLKSQPLDVLEINEDWPLKTRKIVLKRFGALVDKQDGIMEIGYGKQEVL